MKISKKAFRLLLAGLMAFSFAACGSAAEADQSLDEMKEEIFAHLEKLCAEK